MLFKSVSVIEDRTSILQTYWYRRHSTGSALPPDITHMSTEQLHVCQEMEDKYHVPALILITNFVYNKV